MQIGKLYGTFLRTEGDYWKWIGAIELRLFTLNMKCLFFIISWVHIVFRWKRGLHLITIVTNRCNWFKLVNWYSKIALPSCWYVARTSFLAYAKNLHNAVFGPWQMRRICAAKKSSHMQNRRNFRPHIIGTVAVLNAIIPHNAGENCLQMKNPHVRKNIRICKQTHTPKNPQTRNWIAYICDFMRKSANNLRIWSRILVAYATIV